MPLLYRGILEIVASFSPFKVIQDWRHENTLREQQRLQTEVERQKIEVERERVKVEKEKIEASREQALLQSGLERERIQCEAEQNYLRIQGEIEKETIEVVRVLIREGHLPKAVSKEIIVALLVGEALQRDERMPANRTNGCLQSGVLKTIESAAKEPIEELATLAPGGLESASATESVAPPIRADRT